MPLTNVKTYEDINTFQLDASIMANSGWTIASQVSQDNRKGSTGWFIFWIVAGFLTAGIGWIGCIFTFPRGKQLYHVTYSKAD